MFVRLLALIVLLTGTALIIATGEPRFTVMIVVGVIVLTSQSSRTN